LGRLEPGEFKQRLAAWRDSVNGGGERITTALPGPPEREIPGETKTIILMTWDGREVPYEVGKNYKATFNETSEEVGWARWTTNPITGCLHP
jgi:hypothetical protein